MKYLIANWKMSLSLAGTRDLATAFIETFKERVSSDITVGVAPALVALESVNQIFQSTDIVTVAQNAHWAEKGAFTGETSFVYLKELGCKYAIVGHSERRHVFGETDSLVAKRFAGLLDAGITPILCIGETAEERRAGKTFEVVDRQMNACATLTKDKKNPYILAYEPVWAISDGTNPTPATPEDVAVAHEYIFNSAPKLFGYSPDAILYGGSANPDNAAILAKIPHVEGYLVGGASLDAMKFGKVWDGLNS